MNIPSLAEFLTTPVGDIRSIVPTTLIFAAGGTRRGAALAGVPFEDYPSWTLPHMLATCKRFFDHGIKHLITPLAHPRMFQEEGYYGQNFVRWMEQGLAGQDTITYYHASNWQVHLIVAASSAADDPHVRHLRQLAELLGRDAPHTPSAHLWYFVVPDYDDLWCWMFEKWANLKKEEQAVREQAVCALYGMNIPPADILISFGKPTLSPDVLPPFLWNLVQAYWTQQPSYQLDNDMLRRILYDYAYARNTYRINKTGREREALYQPALWKRGPTIGLGIRVGPYWYPEPFSLPTDDA